MSAEISICNVVLIALATHDLDGERMDEELGQQVEAHLRSCEECREKRRRGEYDLRG